MEFVQDAVRGGILIITTSALAALITQAFTILRQLTAYAEIAANPKAILIAMASALLATPVNTFGNNSALTTMPDHLTVTDFLWRFFIANFRKILRFYFATSQLPKTQQTSEGRNRLPKDIFVSLKSFSVLCANIGIWLPEWK
jgi:hypothetical protein